MAAGDIISVKLNRERPYHIRWTKRARNRNASLKRPAAFHELANPRRRFYVLTALIWAALVEKDHGFEEPEDLADFLEDPEQQVVALKAVGDMIKEAFPEKKTPPNLDSSESGPPPSSSGVSVPPPSTGGS